MPEPAQRRAPEYQYLLPLVWAPVIPLTRIAFRGAGVTGAEGAGVLTLGAGNPRRQSLAFGATVGAALIHGASMILFGDKYV